MIRGTEVRLTGEEQAAIMTRLQAVVESNYYMWGIQQEEFQKNMRVLTGRKYAMTYSHQCFMRAMQELEPSYFYVWLSRNQEGRMNPQRDRLFLYDDIQMSFNAQAAMAAGRLAELFNRQNGRYPVDAVFTSRAGFASMLAVGLANQAGPPVPVVIAEPRVYWMGSEAHHNMVGYHDTVLRAAGYASCVAIYWSLWEKKEALDGASVLLASSALKHIDEYGFVVDPLVDLSPHQRTRGKLKRLLFAGRLNENKRYHDILSAYGKVLMARDDVEVWIHSGTGAYAKLDPKDSRWHRTSENMSRDDYSVLLAGSQVGAYLSRDEGANITVLEMILAGIVLALPKRPWVEKLFSPLVYPFVCPESKLPALLDWLLDNYDEAYAQLEPIRKMIVERNSWPAFKSKMQKVLDMITDGRQVEAFRKFKNVVLEMMEHQTRRSLSFDVALQSTQAWREWPQVLSTRSAYAGYQAVRDMDDMSSAIPMFQARDEDFEWLRREKAASAVKTSREG